MSAGCKHSPDDLEIVVGDMRDCVMASHWSGGRTVSALARIAEAYGVSVRWAHKTFFRDGYVRVDRHRRRKLALAAADFLDLIADDLERKAAPCRALADGKRKREQQACGGEGLDRCAA